MGRECGGHPSGPFDEPMGQTVYCDGSCDVVSLNIALTKQDDTEWLLEIDGDGELDGEVHVMVLLSPSEVAQLKEAVWNG